MGRLPVNDCGSYELEKLWPIHREILRRSFVGQKNVDIARALGVTTAMVSYTLNCELGKRQLARMQRDGHSNVVDISERLAEISPQALGVIEETINDPDEAKKLRTDLAKDVLDRAGFGAVKKFQGQVANAIITSEDIADMKRGLHSQVVDSVEVLEEDAV